MKKYDLEFYVVIIVICLVLWIGISTAIQRFKCAKMTETELFLNIPHAILLDFKDC